MTRLYPYIIEWETENPHPEDAHDVWDGAVKSFRVLYALRLGSFCRMTYAQEYLQFEEDRKLRVIEREGVLLSEVQSSKEAAFALRGLRGVRSVRRVS